MDAPNDRTHARVIAPSIELSAAVTMLSRIPSRGPAPAAIGDVGTGAAAFGLVGAVLGAVAAAVLVLASPIGPTVAALLAVSTLALISGGLHLDGLADTADALAAPNAARAEEARLDPRAGTAAVVAIAIALALDTALIAELGARGATVAAASVIVAAAVSRAVAAATPIVARGRVRTGSATWFVTRTSAVASPIALASAVLVAVVASALVRAPEVALGGFGGVVVAALAAEWLIRRRGALDGDGIGAIVEIAFASVLLATVAFERIV
jgi:adenosylcobinamide-GDP ribazoletransferase